MTRRRSEDGRGDAAGRRAKTERSGPAGSRNVVVATASQAWVRRFEIRGAWPFVSAAEVEERFEQLVRRRWISAGGPPAHAGRGTAAPAVDVFEADGDIWVEIDLPGVALETVRARIENGDLVVEAERLAAAPARGARPTSMERPHGPLRRRIRLPHLPADARIEQRFEGGVLQVRIRSASRRP